MAAAKNLTPAELSLRGQLAVHTSWANTTDIDARTEPGLQAANVTRFEKLVDPDGKLDPDERARRVKHARQAHMVRMALASAKARRLRAQAGGDEP
jgi:hypothetical protein